MVSNISHDLSSVICLHTVCSICAIDRILLDATTPGQSRPWRKDNEGVPHIPRISKTGASPSDYLMVYPGHLFGGGAFFFAKMQLVYSTAPDNWAVVSLYLLGSDVLVK